jgi:hypothetical protein
MAPGLSHACCLVLYHNAASFFSRNLFPRKGLAGPSGTDMLQDLYQESGAVPSVKVRGIFNIFQGVAGYARKGKK